MTANNSHSYRVGLLGAGFISDRHAAGLKAVPHAQLVAVCDLSRRRAEDLAKTFKIEEIYTDLGEMLANAQLDVVHVLTPPNIHYGPIRQCLEAGVHVFTEKPMCTDTQEATQLLKLVSDSGQVLGVSHNFLYMPGYQKLRTDVHEGVLGRIDRIEVIWAKELGLPISGPYDVWMLRDPGNMAYEIGPHPFSFVLDLLGHPEVDRFEPEEPMTLPTGVTFFKRWNIRFKKGQTQCDLYLNFVVGSFEEHEVRVRGSLGRGRVDMERNTYVLEQHNALDIDVDHLVVGTKNAVGIARQAVATFGNYALNKTKLSNVGKNPYDTSIAEAIKDFYVSIGEGTLDARLSPDYALNILKLGDRMAEVARQSAGPQPAAATAATRPSRPATNLVFGGTGFIGKELVRQLVQNGETVRILGRSAVPGLWRDIDESKLDIVKGSMANDDDLAAAFQGIEKVYHLARAPASTWEEWESMDILPTQKIAELCLANKVKRLVYTSTVHCYYTGNPDEIITRDTPLDPKMGQRTYYSRAKSKCEAMLLEMYRNQGLDVVITRPGVVVGTGGSPFHWGIGYWNFDRVCQFWGQGTNTVPVVLVEDVATGLILSMDTPNIEGQSFNFIGDVPLTGREYVEEFERYSGIKIEARPTPIASFYAGDFFKWLVKMAVRHPTRARVPSYRDWLSNAHLCKYDCTESKEILGWKPERSRQQVIDRGIHVPVNEFV
ncbi:MAG: Gfo/Idh/MocA family oxidoreductase [Myxococcales bacterium]|nr:Gfo/Idh/MocA family oxidoreductase [Myxococcales bacterium]